ncbi:hypothetical protein M8A54_004179 [Salmonella enterica]|nr:hypothetical protein [Salmonella enterica]
MKSLYFAIFLMNCAPLPAHAIYFYYLWTSANNATGNLNYTGPAISEFTGKFNSLYTGTMSVTKTSCSQSGDAQTYYRADDRWIFIPTTINLAGKDASLKPVTPYGYNSYGKINGYYTFASRSAVNSYTMVKACFPVGYSYPINYTYPSVKIAIDITGINSGNYTGTIPLKFAYAEYFNTSSFIEKYSNSEALQYSTTSLIPYNIDITNTCSALSQSVSIDHGEVNSLTANDSKSKGKITITCDETALITLSLKAITTPLSKYSDGVGVGLGKSWDTVLSIKNSSLSDISPTQKLNFPAGSNILDIESTLKKGEKSSPGFLQGSAVLTLSIE